MEGCGGLNTTDNANCLTFAGNDQGIVPLPIWVNYFKIVYILLIIVIAVPGNCMVIFVQAKNRRRSSTDCLVVAMAICDLILAGLNGPFIILKSINGISDIIVTDWACKIYYYIIYCVTFASTQLLAAVAFDRYRHTCRPHEKTFHPRKAVRLSCFIAVNSVVICAVMVFISGANEVANDCVIHKDSRLETTVFNIILGGLFLGMFIVVIICYSMICHALHYQYRKKADVRQSSLKSIRKQQREPEVNDKENTCIKVISLRKSNKVGNDPCHSRTDREIDKKVELERVKVSATCGIGNNVFPGTSYAGENMGNNNIKRKSEIETKTSSNPTTRKCEAEIFCNVKGKGKHSNDLKGKRILNQRMSLKFSRISETQNVKRQGKVSVNGKEEMLVDRQLSMEYNRISKTSKMMFLITITYILSWVIVWCSGGYASVGENGQTVAGRTITSLVILSYMVNCVSNPIFYFFMSTKFRECVKEVICK